MTTIIHSTFRTKLLSRTSFTEQTRRKIDTLLNFERKWKEIFTDDNLRATVTASEEQLPERENGHAGRTCKTTNSVADNSG
jgi:hypothetical protein